MDVSNLLDYGERRVSLADRTLKEVLKGRPVACGRGCAYCCYGVTLWLRKIEVLLIARSLNRKKPKERTVIAKKLREYTRIYDEESKRAGYRPVSPIREGDLDLEKVSLVGGLAMNEVPCPFLSEEGTCEVYQDRPLMCRLTLFKDRDLCRKDWENPLSFIWRREIAPFVEEVKEEFFPRFRRALANLRDETEISSVWEEDLVFITDYLRFDPLKKVFYVKEGGFKLIP